MRAMQWQQTEVLKNAASKLGNTLKARLNLVLGTIVLAEQRLSPTALNALLDLPAGAVRGVLPFLSAVLTFPNGDDDPTPIGVIHLSFPNFLVDPTRCTDESFLVQPRSQHTVITSKCLKLMSEELKYDILGIASESGHNCTLNSEILDLQAKTSQHLSDALQYACKYWTRHLCQAAVDEALLTALKNFCTSHLLYWLEVLSFLGCIDGALEALQSSQSLRPTDVPSLLHDCERAVRAFYPVISTSAIHMYSTLALFAPRGSHIRRLAAVDARPPPGTLSFSPDGRCIACTNMDGSIRVLNAQTGAELQVCQANPSMWKVTISFSPTGKELLLSIENGAVYVWDVTTGVKLEIGTTTTSRDHSTEGSFDMPLPPYPSNEAVDKQVAWSPNGKLVASCQRQTISLWREASLNQSDGYLLASSDDGRCQIWDARSVDWDMEAGVTLTQTLKHNSDIVTMAVSSDSRLVACGLRSGETVLWTKSDGKRVGSLPGPRPVISLMFYSNGLLAAAYKRSPFVLWDVSTGSPVKTESEGGDLAVFAPDGRHIAQATRNL
ncbi:hypothetical protein ONZ51_g11817 [Trametes cubensis]|uniref:Anaphase-promoting complex subunit 4 WD40 domain-containing protein n=1 Tax=Trametes cubensis TaxID=1111947 RepID=A0AAD7X5Z2_9APHY|nr:hypothetical protein ONZ51_g11817 [Trametes cubensis]